MQVELVERLRILEENFHPTGALDEKARRGLDKGLIPLGWMEELVGAGYVMQNVKQQYVLTPPGRRHLKAKFPVEFDAAEDRWAEDVIADMKARALQYKVHQELVANAKKERS